MERLNLCKEVLENAIGVHRTLEKIEPLQPLDIVAVQAMEELLQYKTAEEQGLLLRLPCKVGDKAYLIDKDENGHLKVYEGVWDSVAMAQRKNSNFEVRGHISYDVYDFFYDDGRTMLHGMYVGQENTKFGKVVFLTREEAERALAEMQKG